MLLANPSVQKLLKAFLLSQLGIALKNIFWKAVGSAIGGKPNTSQSGQAGAVPAPDPAPLTGGPHADSPVNKTDPILTPIDDWNGKNFNVHTTGNIADVANGEISEDGHGSNGTPYDR